MKPAWDELSELYTDSSKVVVADVDCTVHNDLCGEHGVSGYPTIKYYTAEKPGGDSYQGGRDLESLKSFVEENLSAKCDVASLEDCDDKQKKYIEKMKAKGADEQKKELERLKSMSSSSVAPDKKAWMAQRTVLLKEMVEL
jgi:protein disulfide-isomerase A6